MKASAQSLQFKVYDWYFMVEQYFHVVSQILFCIPQELALAADEAVILVS